MPPDDRRYEPADVAEALNLPLGAVLAIAPKMPRSWNISTDQWWCSAEQVEVWRRYFAPQLELPTVRTRTLSPDPPPAYVRQPHRDFSGRFAVES